MTIDEYTEPNLDWHQWHPTFSVTLGQLKNDGLIDWTTTDNQFYWGDTAYNATVYERLCSGIEQRYWFREISMTPPKRWIYKFMYKLRYELCPKYNRLYAIWDDLDILQDSDKYGKRREIGSDFPETLLSDNANYVSTGEDEEYEDIEHGRVLDAIPEYIRSWRDVDASFLDDLEPMFATVVTFNVNV